MELNKAEIYTRNGNKIDLSMRLDLDQVILSIENLYTSEKAQLNKQETKTLAYLLLAYAESIKE